jgi:histidyl-tRNA synthetase
MEIKLKSTYKGTRILFGEKAKKKRNLLNNAQLLLESFNYNEMMLPIIQLSETFNKKVGDENQHLMYNFLDRGNRNICLAPEYTAVVQQMSKETFKMQNDVKLFYIGECFRGEKPQAGRYRQFTQLGVEIINPKSNYTDELLVLAKSIIELVTTNYEVNTDVTRGLDYYTNGLGFEISCPELGAQKQICGGGSYQGGIGFAIGIDRLLLL